MEKLSSNSGWLCIIRSGSRTVELSQSPRPRALGTKTMLGKPGQIYFYVSRFLTAEK